MDFIAGYGATNVDLLFGGMSRIPQEGEEIYAESFSLQLGGGYPATMINLGRLGIPCKIQTFLGSDMFSEFAKKQYEAAGVKPLCLKSDVSIPVNVTSAAITKTDRAFTSYSDCPKMTEKDMETVYEASLGARFVFVSDDLLPIYPELKRHGSILIYDTGWRDDMSEDSMQEILKLVDYYTPNSKEAMKITGTDTPEKAIISLSRYFDYPVVKLDKDGCMYMQNGKINIVPAVKGIHCIDTTGAGDAFLAGFVYGLYHNVPIETAVLYGNRTGAASVTQMGCLAGYLTEDELVIGNI